jgi:hypothetical protein
MTDSPEPILAARDAWRAAMAAYEAQRLEVNRLWLAYLELADPGRAPKIRRFLKHGEAGRRVVSGCGVPWGIDTTAARARHRHPRTGDAGHI